VLSIGTVLGDYRIHSNNYWTSLNLPNYKKIWQTCKLKESTCRLLISYETKTGFEISRPLFVHHQMMTCKSKLIYKLLEKEKAHLSEENAFSVILEGVYLACSSKHISMFKKFRVSCWFLLFPLLTKQWQEKVAKRAFGVDFFFFDPAHLTVTMTPFLNAHYTSAHQEEN
jgi:hypothetical protein